MERLSLAHSYLRCDHQRRYRIFRLAPCARTGILSFCRPSGYAFCNWHTLSWLLPQQFILLRMACLNGRTKPSFMRKPVPGPIHVDGEERYIMGNVGKRGYSNKSNNGSLERYCRCGDWLCRARGSFGPATAHYIQLASQQNRKVFSLVPGHLS